VDLDKIESSLRAHPGVTDAVVMAASAHAAGLVVAFVTCPADVSIGELRRHAQAELPDLDSASLRLVLVEEPTGQDGEVDLAVLERLLEEEVLRADQYVAPGAGTETGLAAIWQDLLRVDQVSATEDFTLLGGTSLKAAELQIEIFRRFDIGLELAVILASESLRSLAREIDEAVSFSRGE